jgi:hypothetical protein
MSKYLTFLLDQEHLDMWNWLIDFYKSKTGSKVSGADLFRFLIEEAYSYSINHK